MGNVSAPRRRRNQNFDLPAKRRKEIVQHARLVGAMDTEDRSRWLIAWHWHNRKAIDPIWSLMEAAKRMGGKITEAEASAITEEASITRKHLSADNLAKFLGVTYAQRQDLRLTTIGSVDVKKRARKELRKRRDRVAKEAKRRALGMRPQSESLSATKPWEKLGMSRTVWYRQNKARRKGGTTLSAAIFLSGEDRPVPSIGVEGLAERAEAPLAPLPWRHGAAAPQGQAAATGHPSGADAPKKEGRGYPSSQTASTMAADRYASLPLELRLAALCLPLPENLARAA
jgi:hypothetical protein